MPTTYEIHKIASYYPKLLLREFVALKESIKRDGLLNPITLFEGKILDGTNRYKACLEEGVEPIFRELPPGVDPINYVIDQNETRRHLAKEQLVLIGARMAKVGRGGNRRDGYDPSQHTVEKVAAKLKVSKTGIKRAQTVLRKGSPKVVEALEQSELTVHEAEQISHLPHVEQEHVLGAMKEDRATKKKAQEELKSAKKKGLKVPTVPKPVVSDLDKRWKEFAPQFKSILRLFKMFKSIDEHSVIRARIHQTLDEMGLGVK